MTAKEIQQKLSESGANMLDPVTLSWALSHLLKRTVELEDEIEQLKAKSARSAAFGVL